MSTWHRPCFSSTRNLAGSSLHLILFGKCLCDGGWCCLVDIVIVPAFKGWRKREQGGGSLQMGVQLKATSVLTHGTKEEEKK